MNTKTPEQLAYEAVGSAFQLLWAPPRKWNDIPKHEQDAWKAVTNAVRAHQLAQTFEAENNHPYRRTLLEQAFQEAQKRGVPVAVVLLDYLMGLKSDLLILAGSVGKAEGPKREPTDHIHEMGSCGHCDTISDLTGPKKPTKPSEDM